MIEYILISYVVMLVVCLFMLIGGYGAKNTLKYWLVSPLSMPYFFIVAFLEW